MPFRSGGGSGGGGGSGTVTSVGVAADSGTGSSITSSGTITISGSGGLTTSVSGTTVTVAGTASANFNTTSITVSDTPYSVASSDQVIFVDVTGGDVEVKLPTSPQAGRAIYVVDIGNSSPSGNKVTVNGNGNNIVGSPTLDLDSGFQSITVVGNSSAYFLL